MALGSVRVKDVDTARSDIVAIAKKLIENGEIDVALNNVDDEFVV
jgi:flagellar motor switch protein FliG